MKRSLLLVAAAALVALPNAAVAQPPATGGPDGFGYSYARTNNPAAFVSIKGAGGTLISSGGDPPTTLLDDRFYQAPIPFNFPFYGTNRTQAFISTNGYIAFEGTTNTAGGLDVQESFSFTNANMATATLPLGNMQVDRAFLAPWWDDMQFTAAQAGGLYSLTRTVAGRQEFVVEWNNVAFFNAAANGVTFQAILRSDGTMTFIYPDVTNGASGTNGASATIGLHDLGGTNAVGNNRFLQYSFNTANALANGDVLNLTPIPEPGTLALCGVAALGGLYKFRRRKAVTA